MAEFNLYDWACVKPAQFDHEAEFLEQIQPLLDQAAAKCRELGISIMMVACVSQKELDEHYHNRIMTCTEFGDPTKTPPNMLASNIAANYFEHVREFLNDLDYAMEIRHSDTSIH